MLTKEHIIHLLREDKRAVARALVVLHNRQTSDEKVQEGTRHRNGRGFRPCHARMGSSMAKQFLQKGFLSDKQINYWRVPDATGSMRIGIYAGQLLEEAEMKAQEKKQAAVARDFGNDMEQRMVMEEISQTSSNPEEAKAAKESMDEIDAFWAAIKAKQGK